MKIKVFDYVLWIMTLLLTVGVFLMPETVPVHWDANWEVDGYGSRYLFLIIVFLPVLVYYEMSLTKRIDPKRCNLEKERKHIVYFNVDLHYSFWSWQFFSNI
ncbi:DUF1648 domain-containing protein [Allocoprobacillus halotolerans]|uniref:DUF1648 domain-containing protein n=1 Tax=Allocoprobacillus halotolerans TaxID=2944914 RepID=A0ABY5I5S3_9FIRM|nr:DUF1648 domain-containing protein [Allocoprobacillus halotolerans]UTY40117.1 DUF1648 domain-containing protein [Allocoprobacillus halotolerans]